MINYKAIYSNKLCLLSLVILLLGSSCKEKKNQTVESTPVPEVEKVQILSPVYKEIARFMDLEVSDSTQIESVLNFKAIMGADSVVSTDAAQNLKFYKDITNNGKAPAMPVFEIKGSDLSLVLFTGKGYVGPVWAKVLVDKSTGKTVKVRFSHKLESEGYGNGIVSSAFGDQFSDQKISTEENTFGLVQSGVTVIEGTVLVDGVSGATATSSAVVQMLNEGLKKYLNTN